MTLKPYQDKNREEISKLFYETVHSVNARDYTEEQLFAWAKHEQSLLARRNDLFKQRTLIAEQNGKIVGFASVDSSGCLDLLFVHKDFQRRGIATALCDELEKGFPVVRTYASVTAKPFFERRGYSVTEEREVERSGVKLKNYEMRKQNEVL